MKRSSGLKSHEILIIVIVFVVLMIFVVLSYVFMKEGFAMIPGSLKQLSGGNWSFTPSTNYYGPITLSYVLTDGYSTSAPDSLIFYVNHVLQPLIASNSAPVYTGSPVSTSAAGLPVTYTFTGQNLLNLVGLTGGEPNQNINYVVISAINQKYLPSANIPIPPSQGPGGSFSYTDTTSSAGILVTMANPLTTTSTLSPSLSTVTQSAGVYPISLNGNLISQNGPTISSANGLYTLVMQPTGSLTINASNGIIANTPTTTTGSGPYSAILTSSGLLSIISSSGGSVWSSGSSGGIGPYNAILRNDARLAIYDSQNALIWTSDGNNGGSSFIYNTGSTPIPSQTQTQTQTQTQLFTSSNSINSVPNTIFTYTVYVDS